MSFLETLRNLPVQRQIMLGAAVAGMIIAMSVLARGLLQEPMGLLYSGLDPARSGEIMEALEQRNISYEIKGESIFVPKGERDSIRFSLAQDGLPRQDVQGYELLDNVNGFSITSEMYNASYWRAKEGELTRTVLAIPGVDSARVHIGANLRSGFTRNRTLPTASVTLSTTRRLSADQAEAIQYLIALAVSGLSPDDVAVIDSEAGIIAGPNSDGAGAPGLMANDVASGIEAKVQRLLEARVGPGNARVSVSVDLSRNMERISEVTFDPESRVVRQRTTNDSSEANEGGGSNGGAVTVASNLPQEQNPSSQQSSTIKNSVESVSYELNEVRRETERMPGEVQRISIAVLLNETAFSVDPAAASPAEDASRIVGEFEQLISIAAGVDLARGDAVTVELMPFSPVENEEGLVSSPGMAERLMEQYLWQAIQTVFVGVIVLALGFGVIRPMFKTSNAQLAGGSQGADGESAFPSTDPVEFLKNFSSEKPDETAAILQDWLNTDQKAAANDQ
ncbi:MAG: flagellar basal-body MS-ring/collar protein FliF [Pseudomonadota bacterium]